MKKLLELKKKHHFKFKESTGFNKHILKFGSAGFKTDRSKCIPLKQEDLLKLLILKNLKKTYQKKWKIFFYLGYPYNKTNLPLESRMGKGKGEINYSFNYYRAGSMLFELKGVGFTNLKSLRLQLNKKNIIKLKLIS